MKNLFNGFLFITVIALISTSCEKEEVNNLPTPPNSQLSNFVIDEFTPTNEQAVNLVKHFFKDRYYYVEEITDSISDWKADKALWTIEAAANYHFPYRSENSFSNIYCDSLSHELEFFTDDEDIIMIDGFELCYVYEQLKSYISNLTEQEGMKIIFIDLVSGLEDETFNLKFKVAYGLKGNPPMGTYPVPLPTGYYNAKQAGDEFHIRINNALPINNLVSYQLGSPYYYNNIYGNMGSFVFYASNNTELWGPITTTLTGFVKPDTYWNSWLNSTWELAGRYHDDVIDTRVTFAANVYPGEYFIDPLYKASHNMQMKSAKWYPNSEDIATY